MKRGKIAFSILGSLLSIGLNSCGLTKGIPGRIALYEEDLKLEKFNKYEFLEWQPISTPLIYATPIRNIDETPLPSIKLPQPVPFNAAAHCAPPREDGWASCTVTFTDNNSEFTSGDEWETVVSKPNRIGANTIYERFDVEYEKGHSPAFLTEQTSNNADAITDLEVVVDNINNTITNLETIVNEHTDRLENHEGRIDYLERITKDDSSNEIDPNLLNNTRVYFVNSSGDEINTKEYSLSNTGDKVRLEIPSHLLNLLRTSPSCTLEERGNNPCITVQYEGITPTSNPSYWEAPIHSSVIRDCEVPFPNPWEAIQVECKATLEDGSKLIKRNSAEIYAE